MTIPMATIIRAVFPHFAPERTKLHLAQWNGREAPLDVFHAGDFEEWQADQTQRNFQRDYVLALIETPRPDVWLFAGIWRRLGEPDHGQEIWATKRGLPARNLWVYRLELVANVETLAGRLHVRYAKRSRASYRKLETCCDEITVSSLIEQPRNFPRFVGFRDVLLTMGQLRLMYDVAPEDWRTALSTVGGVYVITTADGTHYVGSASGVRGFWGRWRDYADTGHANNSLLRHRLGDDPLQASQNFQFAIFETADSAATRPEVVQREAHWKRALGSRAFGLNLN